MNIFADNAGMFGYSDDLCAYTLLTWNDAFVSLAAVLLESLR